MIKTLDTELLCFLSFINVLDLNFTAHLNELLKCGIAQYLVYPAQIIALNDGWSLYEIRTLLEQYIFPL